MTEQIQVLTPRVVTVGPDWALIIPAIIVLIAIIASISYVVTSVYTNRRKK